MKKTLFVLVIFLFTSLLYAEDAPELGSEEELEYQQMIDSIEASFEYEIGVIELENGLATLIVPNGYRFMGAEQSAYVLSSLWGNPPSAVIGMLFPKGVTPLGDGFTYVVSITYSEEGYIDDEDAKDLDYDELLETMQEDVLVANEQRLAQGYGTAELIGWASPPYYDDANKKLHWAKELNFDNAETNTLNYNIRILGRRGYLNMNAIGDMDVLPLVKKDVDQILASVEFNEGNTYADFDPDIDEIAAYGIGGLIAGKVLLKVGLLAGLLKFLKVIGLAMVKFWKPIAIGVAALGAGIKKFFFTKEKEKEPYKREEEIAPVAELAEREEEPAENDEVTDSDFEDEAQSSK
ncbi:MAG: DUF2167 domain-containing protein [Flavobacteriales bacterium]|nr:DUF2167 domain-containing protein [Flavobacteriales bacterium]